MFNKKYWVLGGMSFAAMVFIFHLITNPASELRSNNVEEIHVYSIAVRPSLFEIYVPTEQEQKYIHDKIFSELQIPIVKEETKAGFLSIIKRMVDQNGIEGVILGCTELPLILIEDTYGIKFINTSQVHIESAIKYIFSGALR